MKTISSRYDRQLAVQGLFLGPEGKGGDERLDEIPDSVQYGLVAALLAERMTTAEYAGLVVGMALYEAMKLIDADEADGSQGTGMIDGMAKVFAKLIGQNQKALVVSFGGHPSDTSGPALDRANHALILAGYIEAAELAGAGLEMVNVPGDLLSNSDSAKSWVTEALKSVLSVVPGVGRFIDAMG